MDERDYSLQIVLEEFGKNIKSILESRFSLFGVELLFLLSLSPS